MLLNNKKKVFYKLLISYVLISAIPLLILGAVFYYFNVINLQKEIEENYISKLTQATDRIDIALKELRTITQHVSNNSRTFSIMSKDIYSYSEKEIEIDIISQLQAYKDSTPILDDMIFYFRGKDSIYLSSGRYHYSDFEGNIKSDVKWSHAGFFKNINSITFPVITRVNPKVIYSGGNNGKLVYIFPVPYLSTFAQGTIAFIFNESVLLSMMDDFLGDFNGFTYVFDNYSNTIISRNKGINNTGAGEIESTLKSYRGTGVHSIKLRSRNFKVMRIVSEETGWSYVTVIAEAEFFDRVYVMRNILYVTIIVLILFGLFSALILSIRNYKPIKTLLNYIDNEAPQLLNEKLNNEFDIIRSSFISTIHKNKELNVQVNTQRLMVKDQCLLKILRGIIKDNQELERLLKCSNLQLNGSLYFVIVLSINNINATKEIVEMALKLVEDFYFPGGRGYGVELVQERSIAVCVRLNEISTDIKALQFTISKGIDSLLKENLGWRPIVGIGNPCNEILKLNTSFIEAQAAVFDNLTNYNSNIHFYCDIEYSRKQVQWYPISEQALYIQSLKQGDKIVAINTLEIIIEKLAMKITSYKMIRCLCFEIINNIIKTVNQLGLGSFDLDMIELTEFSNLDEFKRKTSEFTIEYCDNVAKYKESKFSTIKNNIIDFVINNFKDSSISLESIADRFDISTTYLSRLFKEETGVNFIDYITNLRMDRVKLELKTTNKPIKYIIRDAGYIDIASFFRKFKSIEGITPGKYRELPY